MPFTYNAQKTKGNGLEATLSAEWDTRRDACLAAKLRYNLSLEEYNVLLAKGRIIHRGIEITVTGQ